MARVIDVFTYNGEADLLEIRLNILNDYVDEFIIVEFNKTFSGKTKPAYYLQDKKRFKKWKDKIKYQLIGEDVYSKYKELAESSPNTVGAEHWKREFMQKESIKDCLLHLDDDDLVFIGDADEIWDDACVNLAIYRGGMKLPLRVYTYWLNHRSSERFWGTYVARYREIKNECLNHLRSDSYKFSPANAYCGWHFTSMGGYDELKRKLSDSYTRESYWTEAVEDNLKTNLENRKDFLGREFDYKIDESEWPPWLKENKDLEFIKKLCYNE